MDNSTFPRCEELFGTEIWANLPERDQLAVGEFLLDREIGAFEHPFLAARSFFIGDVSPTAIKNTRDLLSAGILSGGNPAANLGRHFAASEDPFVREVADFLGKSDNIRFEFGRFGEAAAFGGHTLSGGQHTVFVNLDAESPDGFLDTLLHETVHCMQRGNVEAGITKIRLEDEPDENSEAVARLRAFLAESRDAITADPVLLAKVKADPRLNNAFFARNDELDQVVEFADDLVTNPRVSALLAEIDVRAEKKSFLSRAWQFVSALVLGKRVEPTAALARRDAILLATPHDYSDLTGIAESSALTDGRAAALQIADNFPARHLVGKHQALFAGVSNEAQYVTRRDQVLSGLREDISGGRFLNRAVNLRPYEAQAGRKISEDEAARMLAEMHTKQKAIQTGWHDYLATGGYTPEVQFLILNTIAREVAMPKQGGGWTFYSLGGNADRLPDPPSPDLAAAVAASLGDPEKKEMRVAALMAEAAATLEAQRRGQRETVQVAASPVDGTGAISWVKFPSKTNDRANFKKNVQDLTALAKTSALFGQCDWCTGNGAAQGQLEMGDFWIGVDEQGRARVAVRMDGNAIGEIRGILRGQNLEPKYAAAVIQLVEEKQMRGGDRFIKDAKIKGTIQEYEDGVLDRAALHAVFQTDSLPDDERDRKLFEKILEYHGAGYSSACLAQKGGRIYEEALTTCPAAIFEADRHSEDWTPEFLLTAFNDGAMDAVKHPNATAELYRAAAESCIAKGLVGYSARTIVMQNTAQCPVDVVERFARQRLIEGCRKGYDIVGLASTLKPELLEEIISKTKDTDTYIAAVLSDGATEAILLKALDSDHKYTAEAAAKHPNATEAVLLKALDNTSADAAGAAAKHKNATPAVLQKGIADSRKYVVEAAIQNPKTTSEMLLGELQSGRVEFLRDMAAHPNAPEPVLREAMKNGGLTSYVAKNPRTPEALLMECLDDSAAYNRRYAALNPSATEAVLLKALSDHDESVADAALNNPNASESLLLTVLESPNPVMRAGAARSVVATERVLLAAARDKKVEVRTAAYMHPNATDAVLSYAASDRSAKTRKLAGISEHAASLALVPLATDKDPEVRSAILSNIGYMSAPVAEIAANEPDKGYRFNHQQAAARSKNASEGILFKVMESDTKDDWRMTRAVAENPSATQSVLLKAIESKDKLVMRAAAGNPNATEPILLAAMSQPDGQARFGAAVHKNATPAVLSLAVHDPDPVVRVQGAKNPAATENVLFQTFEGKYQSHHLLRFAVALNPSATAPILAKSFETEFPDIKVAVFKHPNTDHRIIAEGAASEIPAYKLAVAENPSITADLLAGMANDPILSVQAAARARLESGNYKPAPAQFEGNQMMMPLPAPLPARRGMRM